MSQEVQWKPGLESSNGREMFTEERVVVEGLRLPLGAAARWSGLPDKTALPTAVSSNHSGEKLSAAGLWIGG